MEDGETMLYSQLLRGELAALILAVVIGLGTTARAEPPKVPPLRLEGDDGQTYLQFRLAAQLQLEVADRDAGAAEEREQEVRVRFRRIRPEIRGTLLSEALSYRLHLNLVPGAVELIDLYLGYALHPEAQLLAGQAKVPFTRYRLNSFKDTPLNDWSYETTSFGAERQIGVMLHNGVDRPPRWEYELGVYTGVNARASNAIGMARTFGESSQSPSALVDPAAPAGVHPELVAHLGYNHGGIDPRRPSDLEGGPPRFMVGASAAWDVRPEPAEDMSLRLAPEALLKVHGFSLNGVLFVGFWQPDESAIDSTSLGFLGGVLQASQLLLEQFQVAARYVVVHRTASILEAARARSTQRIAEAPTAEERQQLTDQYRSVGRVSDDHEAGIGFNVYLQGMALVWKTDASVLLHVRSDGDRTDRRIRSLLQLAF